MLEACALEQKQVEKRSAALSRLRGEMPLNIESTAPIDKANRDATTS
jgi:hypothetical protein